MNELIFCLQIIFILAFAFTSLKIGKEALITWVVIQALIANLFVLKQIELFGLHVTASDAFTIGGLLGLNFLQEFFGKEEAKRAVKICFFFMSFFMIVSQLHIAYEPNAYDESASSYDAILSVSPRLLLASMIVFFVVQQIDVRFFSFLKNRFPSLSFGFRTGIALVLSQLLDTILFSYVGLYGIVASVFDIIVISFLIKLIIIIFFSSFIKSVFLKWVKP